MAKKCRCFFAITTILVAAAFGISGCGTTPTHTAALDNAQADYWRAKTDPTVVANAPVALHEAELSLQKAQKASKEEDQRHYAYLARKQSEQAIYLAKQKTAQEGINQLSQERQEVLIEAMGQEAATARAEAETAEERARIAREQQAMAMKQAQVAREQAQMARQQSEQLESQLSDLKARQTNRGSVMLTMGDVMFETNQARLKPGAMLSLDKLADILKQNPNEKVYIEGHTDNTGNAAYNQQLSTNRANAVRDALVTRGISPDLIIARGLGESFPVASNATPAGRQLNRRVDIVVTG
jgi:outer membrane protein OmpA-like peptidoglycan-associated protein